MLTHNNNITNIKTDWYFQKMAEVTFQCPCCFAMETLLVEDGKLINTSRWYQVDGNIFHNHCSKPSHPFAGAKVTLISDNTEYNLLKLAERSKNNIDDLAVEIGVKQITIKRWLSGKSYPNSKSRQKISSFV